MPVGFLASGTVCHFCDHPIAWHTEFNAANGGPTKKCQEFVSLPCNCQRYCVAFSASDEDGLKCNNCGQRYFDHAEVQRAIKARLFKSDRLETMSNDDVGYRVYPAGLKQCCHWTIYHFMKRAEPNTIKPSSSIQCVECKACLTVLSKDEEVVDWAWKYIPAIDSNRMLPGVF